MPAQQLMPAPNQPLPGGVAAVIDVPAHQLLLPPQSHYSLSSSADTAAAHTSVAVSLHPNGSDKIVLELTAVRDNPLPTVAAPSLPSHNNAASSTSTHGATQDSASHAARDSVVHAPLQTASMLSLITSALEEPAAPLLDTQGPPLLDTQGAPSGYTQVHMPKFAWNLRVINLLPAMGEITAQHFCSDTYCDPLCSV